MTDHIAPTGDPADEASLFPKTPGERLRDAREAQGMALAEIAERTRVPIRHLEGIENSDFSALPSPTYAVGFAKAYARAVGLDEAQIGREVRGQRTVVAPTPQYQPYAASDPTRLPPRGLAIGAAVVALLAIVVLALVYGTNLFQGSDGQPTPVVAETAPPAPAAVEPVPLPATGGQVVLTANDVVWLRVYTADATLYEAEMKPGERYEIPADAVKPMINVGRPDKLSVTVNGSAVPALGTGERAIKDVEVSGTALLARATSQPPQPLTSAEPTRPVPARAEPSRAEPSRADPTRAEPTRRAPRTAERRARAPEPREPLSDAEATRRANAAAAAALPGATPAP